MLNSSQGIFLPRTRLIVFCLPVNFRHSQRHVAQLHRDPPPAVGLNPAPTSTHDGPSRWCGDCDSRPPSPPAQDFTELRPILLPPLSLFQPKQPRPRPEPSDPRLPFSNPFKLYNVVVTERAQNCTRFSRYLSAGIYKAMLAVPGAFPNIHAAPCRRCPHATPPNSTFQRPPPDRPLPSLYSLFRHVVVLFSGVEGLIWKERAQGSAYSEARAARTSPEEAGGRSLNTEDSPPGSPSRPPGLSPHPSPPQSRRCCRWRSPPGSCPPPSSSPSRRRAGPHRSRRIRRSSASCPVGETA